MTELNPPAGVDPQGKPDARRPASPTSRSSSTSRSPRPTRWPACRANRSASSSSAIQKGALATYGQGFGAIAVFQRKADPSGQKPLLGGGGRDGITLPQVNIDGDTGQEIATALGTLVTFDSGGVSYIVAGSVPPVAAENAARGLK